MSAQSIPAREFVQAEMGFLFGEGELRQRLTFIVERLGARSTAKEIRAAADEEGISPISPRLLSEIRNYVWPRRKRNDGNSAGQLTPINVLDGDVPRCPACGSSESRVITPKYQGDGSMLRQRRCNNCNSRFDTIERAEASKMFSGKRQHVRLATVALTEKTCSKCKQILPIARFSKVDASRYTSWCRECRNANRSEIQLRQNLRAYGLSMEQYLVIRTRQNDLCAICKKPSLNHSHGKRRQPLVFDHCHETGRFRGLICQHCNRAIGLFGDNAGLLEAAAAYLRASEHGEGVQNGG